MPLSTCVLFFYSIVFFCPIFKFAIKRKKKKKNRLSNLRTKWVHKENSESISGMVMEKEVKQQQVNGDEEVERKKNLTLRTKCIPRAFMVSVHTMISCKRNENRIWFCFSFSGNFPFAFVVVSFFFSLLALNSIISCLFWVFLWCDE